MGFGDSGGFSEGEVIAHSTTGTLTESGSIWFDPSLNKFRVNVTGSAYNLLVTGDGGGTDTNTQNTLDQAYDEGGDGVGAVITVDDQPVQLNATTQQALAVTGTAVFGFSSVEYGNHLPTIGTDTSFYVSGTINNPFEKIVLGGDVVVSGTFRLGSTVDPFFNAPAGSGWYRDGQEYLEFNFGFPDGIGRPLLPHGHSLVRTLKEDVFINGITDLVILMDATNSIVTCSLPPAIPSYKKVYHIKKIDSSGNKVYILPDGTDTIDDDGGMDISTQYTSLSMIASGTNWYIF